MLQNQSFKNSTEPRAPSSYNAQPWRFWYAKANSPQWEKLFALLAGTNAAWAVNADWLVLVGAHQQHEFRGVIGRNPHAAFDTGAACMNFALSATAAGFGCATVGGLNYEKAQELINDDRVAPLAIIVVGSSSLQWGEISPRKDLSMITTTVF